MLKEIINNLNIAETVAEADFKLLSEHLDTAEAWHVINYICFVREYHAYESAPQAYQEQEQHLEALTAEYLQELSRIAELNQLGLRVENSQRLTEILAEKNQLRRQALAEQHRISLGFGYLNIAREHVTALLSQLADNPSLVTNWADLVESLTQTPLFSLHPALKVELERVIGQGLVVDEDTRLRHLLWSDALDITLPEEPKALEAALYPYKQALDTFVAYNPQIATQMETLGLDGDNWYLHVLEYVPFMIIQDLQGFAHYCLEEAGDEAGFKIWQTFLAIAAHRHQVHSTSPEAIEHVARYLLQTSLDEIKARAQNRPLTLDYLLNHYYPEWQLEPHATTVATEAELFRGGTLPSHKSEAYAELLPQLLEWAKRYVADQATQRGIGLPPSLDTNIANSTVDLLLGGLKMYEDFFVDILDPTPGPKNSWLWSLKDIYVMAVVITFENLRWGGGGIKNATKTRFTADLRALLDTD